MGPFLKSTCDIGLCLNRQEIFKISNRGHGHFLKSTGDMGDPHQGPHNWKVGKGAAGNLLKHPRVVDSGGGREGGLL